MNSRRLILVVPCLAGLLATIPALAYEEREERVVQRTTYEEPTPYHDGWIAEHNYNHRLRLERIEREYSSRHPRWHATDGRTD